MTMWQTGSGSIPFQAYVYVALRSVPIWKIKVDGLKLQNNSIDCSHLYPVLVDASDTRTDHIVHVSCRLHQPSSC
jgi:hypothetical protein